MQIILQFDVPTERNVTDLFACLLVPIRAHTFTLEGRVEGMMQVLCGGLKG
jgi:hypothetical protein